MRLGKPIRWVAAILAVLPLKAAAAPKSAPPAGSIRVEFDYSAAELMADAIRRPSLSEAEARSLLENRGIAAMVAKTAVWSPKSTPEGFVADMQSVVATHKYPEGDFALDWVYKYRDQVRTLAGDLRANEDSIRRRITARLTRYAPRTGPVTIKVY